MNELYRKLAALSPERRRLLEKKMAEQGLKIPDTGIPRRDAGQNTLPLSFAQQRLWFMQQLEPGNIAYNMNMVLRLKGPLDREALVRAFAALLVRHEQLRTRFSTGDDGQPVQIVEPVSPVTLDYHDHGGEADPEASVQRLVDDLVGAPHNLGVAPLRAALIGASATDHTLVIGMHHIISDRWSLGVLAHDLSALYEAEVTGGAANLQALDVQFADWALWQRNTLDGPVLQEQLEYWTGRLSGDLPVLELPFDRPRGSVASFSGAHHQILFDRDLAQRLRQLAAKQNVSLFALLLAAFNVLLHLYSDSDDIVIGSEVANRDRPETQTMIGPLVNTLVLRSDLSGNPSFETLLQTVNSNIRNGLARQDIPFERLVEALNPERSLAELNPLFQVKFDLQQNVAPPPVLRDLDISTWPVRDMATKYELRFNLEDNQPDISGKIEYSDRLFDRETIATMARRFETVLAMIADDPQRRLATISLLSPQETEAEIAAASGPVADYPASHCLHELVLAQAEKTPDALAVTDGSLYLTYRNLAAESGRIAAVLVKAGVRPGHRVGVCVRRSARMIPALLGAMEAGAAYVPLDPEYPADRLAFIARDAGLDILLSDHVPAFAADGAVNILDINDLPDAPPVGPVAVSPDHLAYVIYTSGSTGRPKGVAVEHRNVVAFVHWAMERFTTEQVACMLVPTSISFDLSIFELFAPIVMGGALAVADNFLALPELAKKVDITFINTVPSLLQELLQQHRLPGSVKAATFCGEPLPASLVRKLREDYPHLHIHNLYGPSEDTVFSTEVALHGDGYDGGVVPIGVPLPNTSVYILDRAGRLRPRGLSGELYIAGTGVTRGYFGRPAQTAERFLPDPFSGSASSRLYRTGDRVRKRADGMLEFLGRFDHQVKVRGLRIEVGEIEHHLERHPDVEKAVITVTGNPGSADRQLAAFIEPREAATPDESTLKRDLARVLPAHMVPTLWYFVPRLPQQPNGKVDRGALPAIAAAAPGARVAPEGETERLIAAIWAEVLGVEEVFASDNFFRLGGHSLLAMRMIARLPAELSAKDVLRRLFEFPHLRDFAATFSTSEASPGNPAIVPVSRQQPLPLSSAQHRLWTLAQLEPESPFYNIPAALRFHGPVDQQRLRHALELLAERHEALRSRIVEENGKARTYIVPDPVVDFAVLETTASSLFDDLAAEYTRPFDLRKAPLFRTRLFTIGPQEHVLLFVTHHIVSDAQSVRVAMKDLTYLYDAAENGARLTPLSIQYADYAAWQEQQNLDAEVAWWVEKLGGAPPLLDIPTDFPRGAQQDFSGASVRFGLDKTVADRIRQLAAGHDATAFMIVLVAFAILLGRYSGTDDIVIGTPVSHRPDAELDRAIGLFINTLAFRLKPDISDSFAVQIGRTRELVLDGFRNAEAPFERIVDALSVPRNWSHNPVFQAMFTWQTDEAQAAGPAGLIREAVDLPHRSSKVDLTLDIQNRGDRLDCTFIYRTDLFLPETMANMADVFGTLLAALVEAPESPVARLSLLPEKQRRQIDAWNDTASDQISGIDSLHGFFERCVLARPDAIAVTDARQSLSYADLDRRASMLAANMHALGIGRGDFVGICMPRNTDLVCAMLAVLKTGAAYVPLDPAYPDDRIAFIAADAKLSLLLTGEDRDHFRDLSKLDPATIWNDEAGEHGRFRSQGGAGDLAYVIYTSGSTGKPKGVAIEHRNAVAFVNWCLDTFSAEQFSGMLASTSVCFDLSIFEIFATLAAGGRIFLVQDLFELPDAPFANLVTLINTVPTPMAELLRFGPLPAKAATVCLAGEPLPPALADRILAHDTVSELHNLYGPSEDTTYSTAFRIPGAGARIHIGKPIANTRAYVLDEEFQEVPVGLPGELYLAGEGIARGYLNRPDLTAERFLPNPFSAGGSMPVMYRTGDRVRRLADGNLDYLGRSDRQMKISGFRIEPGEIETLILRYPGISGAAVDAWRDETGYTRLAAWVETGISISRAELVHYLGEKLPRHLVPTLFGFVSRLPRLPNGKLDRKALPAPASIGSTNGADDAPREGVEQNLVTIWSALLGRADIGRNDNFFSLGGDSILAIQVVARARQAGIAIAPRDLFQYGTLASLAMAVAGRDADIVTDAAVTGGVPLLPAQHWFFEQDFATPAHWNQSVLLRPLEMLDADTLQAALDALNDNHDALRAVFTRDDGRWRQSYAPPGAGPVLRVVTCTSENSEEIIDAAATALQESFDLARGPLWGALLIDIDGGGQRLVLAAHHLVIDGVSWRILLDDLRAWLDASAAGAALPTPLRTSSVGQRVTELQDFGQEFAYWSDICTADVVPLSPDNPSGSNLVADTDVVEFSASEEETQALLRDVPASYPIRVNEMLFAALFLTLRNHTGRNRMRIILESHGRSDVGGGADLSRTVGWFTAFHPVLFEAADGADAASLLPAVKDCLRAIPHDGIGYGSLKYLADRPLPHLENIADLRFNYLGQTDNLFTGEAIFAPAYEKGGEPRGKDNARGVALEVSGIVSGGRLHMRWAFSRQQYRRETIATLATDFMDNLRVLVGCALAGDEDGYMPSDFPHMDLDQDELENILRNL